MDIVVYKSIKKTSMKKTFKTEAARAAAVIRAELKVKFPGIKFSVKSDTYSMGNSVNIYYDKGSKAPPAKDVEVVVKKFQSGYFDGMTDCYEYTYRGNGPTAKYVFVNAQYPDAVVAAVNATVPRSASPDVYREAYEKTLVAMGY